MNSRIQSTVRASIPSKTADWSVPKISMTTVVDSIIAINRIDTMTNHADDSWYVNFFCSEISVSQLSMFHALFLEKMSEKSEMVDKVSFQQCVVPILSDDQKRMFGGKRFHVLFDKIDANKDGLVSWDDVSLFILQGSRNHHEPLSSSGSYSFFDDKVKKCKSERNFRRQHQNHQEVISCMQVIAHLDVLVTAGHDGRIGVWKLKDLDILQMIQVCPSSSTWITGMTDIAWMDDLNGHATTLCLCTSSMRLYYAQVDEITSAFSVAVPETACPCVYTFQSNENATSIKGFRLFHAENDATILSGSGQNKYDDILAIGFDSGDISIMHSRIDRMRPLERFKIHCHSSTISAFLWIADMSLFVAASHDSNISIHTFNLSRDGVSETKMFIAHSKAIHAIVYSSQDAVVASCGLERDILVWSPFTTQLLARLTGHLSSVFSLAVELQSSHLISLGSDRQVHVWSLTKFNCLCKRKLVTKLHRDVDIKSLVVDGSSLIFGINFPLIWPISKTALPETKTARSASHNSQVLVLLQSDQFEQLITVQADGQATTWAMATGVEITNFCVTPATSVAVNCATLDPKQRRLVVGADDGIIRIYNIFNGQLLHELFRSSSASSSGSSSDIAEVSSLCFVQRQMRTLLAATFSDTSSISFWPEYPTTSLTSAVFNLDIRGQFGVGTPEQIGFLLKDHTSASSNVVVMLMANGKLASISVDSGHTLFEFSVKKTDASFCTHAVSNPGHLVMCKHSKPQTALAINEGESVQSSIRMFVLAHHKNYLIAVASENCVHCWDFARNTFSKSFRVPSRVSGCASTILCMDLSSEDSMLCLGDSHGWIHTYVSLFSAQTDFQAPKWSFHSQADSVSQIKFFGTLEIILSTGSDMVTRVWRLDGKHFLHDESQSSSIDRSFLRTSSSSHALGSSTAIGALACAPWEFRSILLAQGNFSRNSKPRIKDTVHILQRMKSEAKVTTAIIAEQIEHPRPQLFLKSLKLLPPATAQEAREQSRMLLALATPRRGLPATANAACHLQALRGPHCKIHVHPIAPDPYLSPTKGYSSRSLDFMKQDPCRTFLPKDSFKDSILRQEEQVPVRTIEASPLLKRSLKQFTQVEKKTPLANTIEQCLVAAIAATTPRNRPSDLFDSTHAAC